MWPGAPSLREKRERYVREAPDPCPMWPGLLEAPPVSGDRGPESALPVNGAADEKPRQRYRHDQGQDADDRPRSHREVIRIARRFRV